MGLEHLDQAFVLPFVFFQTLELETAGPEAPGGSVAQCRDGFRRFLAGVYEFLGQRADDAVAAGKKLAYLVRVLAYRLYDAAGRGIDNGGNTTGLCIKRVFLAHTDFLMLV